MACAKENAARLGVEARVEVVEADLFPDEAAGLFDLVVSNPPWLPDVARTPLERAVYDPCGRFLARLVEGLARRLAPGGEAWIVISDLAERLGLRPPGTARGARRGARGCASPTSARPGHRTRARPTRQDPLHAFRSAERTRLFRLVATPTPTLPR